MSFLKYIDPRRRRQHAMDRLDVFDLHLVDQLSDVSAAQQAVEPAGEEYPPALRLFQDTLLGLYKGDPQLKEKSEDVTPSHRLNRNVLEQVMEDRAFQDMRLQTRLDKTMSLLGTVNLWERLMEVLTEEQREASRQAIEREREAREWENKAQVLFEAANAAPQGSDKAADFQRQAQDAQQRAQNAQQQAQNAIQSALSASDDPAAQQAIHRAVKRAAEDTAKQSDALNGWGLGPGSPGQVDPEERITLAKRIMTSKRLQRLLDLVGRFRNLAIAAQAEKTERVPGQIEGIEVGNRVNLILPSELALLHHPVLRLDFFRRFVEKQLLQYKTSGRKKMALGPLVVCHDESGSMGGDKALWAMAVTLAMLFLARRQKRPFADVAFSSANQLRVKIISHPEKATLQDVLEIADSGFFNGGTDFHSPLRKAQEIIEEEGKFDKADIIFITDGIADVADEFLRNFHAFKKRTGTRVFAVLADVGQSRARSVERWADQVHRVLDLAHDAQAAEDAAWNVFGAV